jgi:hypothetical protein
MQKGIVRPLGLIMSAGLLPLFFVALPATLAAHAGSDSPVQYCRRVVNDDALRHPPGSLIPAIRRLFGAKEGYERETSYYRCADGGVLLCNVGVNLPCGKANKSATIPAATAWCRHNPNSDFIPLAVTGHDTIYQWRCANGVAKRGKQIGEIDARGFFADHWRRLR